MEYVLIVYYEEYPPEFYVLENFSPKIAEHWFLLKQVKRLQVIPVLPRWFNKHCREKQGVSV